SSKRPAMMTPIKHLCTVTPIHLFNSTFKTIGAHPHVLHPFLRCRSGWVVASLLLGLSSMATPVKLTTEGQSGSKNKYLLPLYLGEDWRTNIIMSNLEGQPANLILGAYDRDGRLLVEIPTLTGLPAEATKPIEPKTIVPPETETLRLQSSSEVFGSLLFVS